MVKWFLFLLLMCFLYLVREIFPPFIVGGIIAYLLAPLVKKLAGSARIDYKWAVAIIYLLFVAVIAFLCLRFGAKVVEEFTMLVGQRREIVANSISQISTTFNWPLDVEQSTNEILSSFEQNFGTPGEIAHIGALLSKGMLATLITVVSSIYLISDGKKVGDFCLRFLPQERRQTAVDLFRQMNSILSKYLKGQAILILLMFGVAYFILHFIFQLKYALLIALLTGFLEVIPFLGPILATTIATVVGMAQIGIDSALFIILWYTGARLTEDYIIVPRVMGHYVELHPLAVIFAVLCGEVTGGALGMFIAIPLAACIKVILDFCYPSVANE